MPDDAPKSLGDPKIRSDRLRALNRPHIRPLTDYVRMLRDEAGEGAEIPFFDPLDGGIDARILFLLEAPGRRAKESGFVSRNNPDETAKNIFQISQEAGFVRSETILWNAVPWYIGDANKIRAANPNDLKNGLRPLPRLLSLLPNLVAIVLVGGKAERAAKSLNAEQYRIFYSPHPSPVFVNRAPGNRQRILEAFLRVREAIAQQGVQRDNSAAR